jgi:hypothetical protein
MVFSPPKQRPSSAPKPVYGSVMAILPSDGDFANITIHQHLGNRALTQINSRERAAYVDLVVLN